MSARVNSKETDFRNFIASNLHVHTWSGAEANCWCPLHDEANPSFSINRYTGAWICFGCHRAGGTVRELQKLIGNLEHQETPCNPQHKNIRASQGYSQPRNLKLPIDTSRQPNMTKKINEPNELTFYGWRDTSVPPPPKRPSRNRRKARLERLNSYMARSDPPPQAWIDSLQAKGIDKARAIDFWHRPNALNNYLLNRR